MMFCHSQRKVTKTKIKINKASRNRFSNSAHSYHSFLALKATSSQVLVLRGIQYPAALSFTGTYLPPPAKWRDGCTGTVQ